MSVHNEYWFRGVWPPETAKHVPLAAAVMAVGPVLAGPEWRGDERRDSATITYWRRIHSMRALEKAARRGVPASYDTTPNLSVNEWLELSRKPTPEPHLPGHRRLRAAQSEIVRAAIWGEIETFYRARGAIEMSPIPADAWASMSFDAVYKSCETDADNYRTRDGSCPIFVSRKSLEAYLRSKAPDIDEKAPRTKGKGGKPPKYDWPKAEKFAMDLLAYHGGIDPLDPDLPDLAAFERAIHEHFGEKDEFPSESLVRSKASAWVKAFTGPITEA